MKKFLSAHRGFFIALMVLVTLLVPVLFFLFSLENLWYEAYAAIIGVVLTAIVTVMLLDGQSRSEEEKDKNIEVYKARLGVYSGFNQKMWDILNDDDIESDEILELQNYFFKEVILHLSSQEIGDMKQILQEMNKEEKLREKGSKYFSRLTVLLQSSLMSRDSRLEGLQCPDAEQIAALRSEFQNLIGKLKNEQTAGQEEVSADASAAAEEQRPGPALTVQSWHFTALGDEQFAALENGNNVISLIEYEGENWRTQALTQIGAGELVFLFRRGGYGYVGAFRAKGYVVYAQEEGQLVKTVCMSGSEPETRSVAYDDPDIRKYDIYGGIEDGATSVATLIVEPICYDSRGVSYVTVYRKTISRFYSPYAGEMLSRFLYYKENNDMVNPLTCVPGAFESLVSENNIKPKSW